MAILTCGASPLKSGIYLTRTLSSIVSNNLACCPESRRANIEPDPLNSMSSVMSGVFMTLRSKSDTPYVPSKSILVSFNARWGLPPHRV